VWLQGANVIINYGKPGYHIYVKKQQRFPSVHCLGQEMLKGSKADTMSMKPMRSTGMTGQSSSLGIWVSPNMYLQIQNTVYKILQDVS